MFPDLDRTNFAMEITVEQFLISNFEWFQTPSTSTLQFLIHHEMWPEAEYGTISKLDSKNISKVNVCYEWF